MLYSPYKLVVCGAKVLLTQLCFVVVLLARRRSIIIVIIYVYNSLRRPTMRDTTA